eukprot:jgi/Astpho2/4760/fgenesh1_pg.00067_%23_217_t
MHYTLSVFQPESGLSGTVHLSHSELARVLGLKPGSLLHSALARRGMAEGGHSKGAACFGLALLEAVEEEQRVMHAQLTAARQEGEAVQRRVAAAERAELAQQHHQELHAVQQSHEQAMYILRKQQHELEAELEHQRERLHFERQHMQAAQEEQHKGLAHQQERLHAQQLELQEHLSAAQLREAQAARKVAEASAELAEARVTVRHEVEQELFVQKEAVRRDRLALESERSQVLELRSQAAGDISALRIAQERLRAVEGSLADAQRRGQAQAATIETQGLQMEQLRVALQVADASCCICMPRLTSIQTEGLQIRQLRVAAQAAQAQAHSTAFHTGAAGRVQDHPTDRRLRQELRKLSSALDKLGLKCRRQGLQLQASAAREQYWKSLAVTRQAGVEQVLKGQEGALQQLEEAGLLLQAAERTQQQVLGGLRDLQRGLALEAGTPGGSHLSTPTRSHRAAPPVNSSALVGLAGLLHTHFPASSAASGSHLLQRVQSLRFHADELSAGVVEARRSMAAACNAAAERYRAAVRTLQASARDSTDTSSSFTAEGSELSIEVDEAFIPAARLPTAASHRLKQPLGGPGLGMHPSGPLLGSHAAAAPYMEPAWQSMHMPGGSAQQAWLQQAAGKTHIGGMPGGEGAAAAHGIAAGQYSGFPTPPMGGLGKQQPASTQQACKPEGETPARPLRPAQAPRELQQVAPPTEPAACSEHEAWGTLGRERSNIDALLQAAPAKPVLGPASQVVSQAGSRYNAAELSDDGDPLAVALQPGPLQGPAGSGRHSSGDTVVRLLGPEVRPAAEGSTGLQPGPLQAGSSVSAADVHQANLNGGHEQGMAQMGREPAEPPEDQDARHAHTLAPTAAGPGMLQEPGVPAEPPGEKPPPLALGHLSPLSRPPVAALRPAALAPTTTSQQARPAEAGVFSKEPITDEVVSEQAGRSLPERTPAAGPAGTPGTVLGASASEEAAASSAPVDHDSRQGTAVLQPDHLDAQSIQARAVAAEPWEPGRLPASGSSLSTADIRVAPGAPGVEAQARPDGGQAALPQLRTPVGASPGHAADRAAAVAQLHQGERGLPGPGVPSVARQLQFQQPVGAPAAPNLSAGAALPTATAPPASEVAQEQAAVAVAAVPSAAEGSEAQLELPGESQATAAEAAAVEGSGALSEHMLAGDTSGRLLGDWPAVPGAEAPAGAMAEPRPHASEASTAAGVHRMEGSGMLPKSVQLSLELPASLPASQPMTTRPLAEQAGTPLDEKVLQPGSPDGAHLVAVLEQHAREQQGVRQLGQLVQEQGGTPPSSRQLGVAQVTEVVQHSGMAAEASTHGTNLQSDAMAALVQPWQLDGHGGGAAMPAERAESAEADSVASELERVDSAELRAAALAAEGSAVSASAGLSVLGVDPAHAAASEPRREAPGHLPLQDESPSALDLPSMYMNDAYLDSLEEPLPAELPEKRKRDSTWIGVMKVTEYPTDRECKAVVLKDKSTVVIYQVRNKETQEEEWFCSDANSTAYSTLKTAQNPVPLKVYPTMAENGTIYCRFAPGS